MFTEKERQYCLQFKDSASHFAGTFAAKEAASKALGVKESPVAALEVRRAADGEPHVYRNGRRLPVAVSITHDGDLAIAVALDTKGSRDGSSRRRQARRNHQR